MMICARFAAILGALALLSTPALAQQRPDAPGAAGALLVSGAHAEGVFDALPVPQMIALRHAQSGMICRFDPNLRNRLTIFPDSPRGDDVACETGDDDQTITLFATRYPMHTTTAEQLRAARLALLQRFPQAQTYRPSRLDPSVLQGLPPSGTMRYAMTLPDGRHAYTRISLVVIGDWTLMLRYTAAAADDAAMQTQDDTAVQVWRAALGDFLQSNAARQQAG